MLQSCISVGIHVAKLLFFLTNTGSLYALHYFCKSPRILWLSSDNNSTYLSNGIVKTFTKLKPSISIISSCVWNCTFKVRFDDNSHTNCVRRELNFDLKRNVPTSSVGSPPPALPVSLRALTHFTRIFPPHHSIPWPRKVCKTFELFDT